MYQSDNHSVISLQSVVNTVLPISVTNTVPNESPLDIPALPTQLVNLTLGTKADDCIALDTSESKENEDFRISAMRKREDLEESIFGDEIQ